MRTTECSRTRSKTRLRPHDGSMYWLRFTCRKMGWLSYLDGASVQNATVHTWSIGNVAYLFAHGLPRRITDAMLQATFAVEERLRLNFTDDVIIAAVPWCSLLCLSPGCRPSCRDRQPEEGAALAQACAAKLHVATVPFAPRVLQLQFRHVHDSRRQVENPNKSPSQPRICSRTLMDCAAIHQ